MSPHVRAPWSSAPRLLLAHGDHTFRAEAVRRLRKRGLEITATSTAGAAHFLARELTPAVVILDTELTDESGPLVCAKMKISAPECKVILVGRQLTGQAERLARFVGADAYMAQSEGWEPLMKLVTCAALPATCS